MKKFPKPGTFCLFKQKIPPTHVSHIMLSCLKTCGHYTKQASPKPMNTRFSHWDAAVAGVPGVSWHPLSHFTMCCHQRDKTVAARRPLGVPYPAHILLSPVGRNNSGRPRRPLSRRRASPGRLTKCCQFTHKMAGRPLPRVGAIYYYEV